MGILMKHLELEGDKGQMEAQALFDTGASYSLIRRDAAEEIATLLPLRRPMTFETADPERRLTATQVVRLAFLLDQHQLSDEFIVLDVLSEPVIIGAATMQKWRLKLDMEREEVVVDPSVTRLRFI